MLSFLGIRQHLSHPQVIQKKLNLIITSVKIKMYKLKRILNGQMNKLNDKLRGIRKLIVR